MKGKTLTIILLSAVLLGVLGLCGLTVFGTYRWAFANRGQMQFSGREGAHAETTETRSFSAEEAAQLEISTKYGEVTVTAAAGDRVEIEIVREAWAEDEAAALAEAEALPVEINQTPSGLALIYRAADTDQLLNLGPEQPSRVSFHLQVPPDTPLRIDTNAGDIRVSGVRAGLEVDSGFGAVSITNVAGAVGAASDSGSIELIGADASQANVHIEAGFGSLTLEDVTAASLTLSGQSGPVSLRRIETTGAISVVSGFGEVRIDDLRAGSLKVEGQSGPILFEQGQVEGLLDLSSEFGNIQVTGVTAGSYRLVSRSGSVNLEGGRGEITVENGFGDIVITGAEEATLDLKSESGAVRFSGSLAGSQPHSVEAGFGDIELKLPSSTALDLNLEAEMGEISSSLPVTVSGELSKNHWQGTLNGGGATLTAVTRSGKIHLLALPETAP